MIKFITEKKVRKKLENIMLGTVNDPFILSVPKWLSGTIFLNQCANGTSQIRNGECCVFQKKKLSEVALAKFYFSIKRAIENNQIHPFSFQIFLNDRSLRSFRYRTDTNSDTKLQITGDVEINIISNINIILNLIAKVTAFFLIYFYKFIKKDANFFCWFSWF